MHVLASYPQLPVTMQVTALTVLLFLLSTVRLPPAAIASTDAVTDTAGQKLQYGEEYYILPVFRGRGGGLTLARRNDTSPFNVAQSDTEVSAGLPVIFSPEVAGDKIIRLSHDLNVRFSAATTCVQSTVWRLGGVDQSTGQRYVTTGGAIGNPGRSTMGNWFKIEMEGQDYKMVFCPGVCDYCKVVCGVVGVFMENGKRWLGLIGGSSFLVMFKKVQKDL